jgi:hypothetical protein
MALKEDRNLVQTLILPKRLQVPRQMTREEIEAIQNQQFDAAEQMSAEEYREWQYQLMKSITEEKDYFMAWVQVGNNEPAVSFYETSVAAWQGIFELLFQLEPKIRDFEFEH